MADSKITALTALTAADPVNDMFPVVDVSDTTMAASGTTKKISVNNILGASGTATLASATITGDLTVDTNVLKVDTTNDRVGIGTASPVSSLQVLDGDITVTTGGSFCGFNGTRQTVPSSGGVQLSRLHFSGYSTGTTYVQGASIQAFSNAAWSASSAPSYLSFQTTPSASVTLSERMRIEAAGDVTISTGNVVMATSGKGIDFSAVTGGTGTATGNVLNDYEEGTWTPVLGGFGGTSGQTYSLQTGRYTKVGRQVICSFEATLTAVGTVTGNAIVSGLPFSSVSTSLNLDGGTTTIGFANNLATNQIFLTGYLNGAGAYSFITAIAAAGTLIGNITAANLFGNTTRLSGTITYTAS
jgi:hypothetical protein